MIGSSYAYAVASHPDKTPYDSSFWRLGVIVVGTALGAWFAYRKSPTTLPVAVATALTTVAGGLHHKRTHGRYVTQTWPHDAAHKAKDVAFNGVMPILHAAESAALVGIGVRASAQHRQTRSHNSAIGGPLIPLDLYPYARKLSLYFMGFSLLGHWAEMLFCTGIKYGIFKGGYDRNNHMLWDQWLFPFPAEGTAAVLAELALTPAKRKVSSIIAATPLPPVLHLPFALVASFVVNFVACTSIDFGTGMVANREYQLWDYRDMRFNYKSQICLQNSLLYSTIATWGVWRLLPALDKAMARASETTLDGIFVGAAAFFVFLELLYQVTPGTSDDGDEA